MPHKKCFFSIKKNVFDCGLCVLLQSRYFPTWSEWEVIASLLCPTLQLFVTPWTVAQQAPLSIGFSRQEYWSGLPFLSPGDRPDSGIKPRSPALQADSLPSEPLSIWYLEFFLLELQAVTYSTGFSVAWGQCCRGQISSIRVEQRFSSRMTLHNYHHCPTLTPTPAPTPGIIGNVLRSCCLYNL